ncbi:MAG: hypothetical protein JWP85_997 [Rhodoglobus sp.]|nr:hypothetical protein [Rhodoglobus sp.]
MTNYDAALGTQYTIRLTVTLTSQNIAANQSTVAWSLTAIKNSGSGFSNASPTPWNVSIGGTGYSGNIASYNFASYSSLLLASGSTTLTHAANGTLNPSVAGNWNPNNAPALAFGNASGSFPLPDIPRGPFYGTAGSYQRTLAHYGTGGSYQQVLVYYGSGGTWNLVGG